ncbi:MAG: hypothetical protein HY814_04205 [Candidatus Riflebacteria bacterium]|nr:hypothetical protein [Candidatus Riflebacteria bacterium]
MGYCECCHSYRDTVEVVLGNQATGAAHKSDLCTECAAKMAVAIHQSGGKVVLVDGRGPSSSHPSSSESSSGLGALGWVVCLCLVGGILFALLR